MKLIVATWLGAAETNSSRFATLIAVALLLGLGGPLLLTVAQPASAAVATNRFPWGQCTWYAFSRRPDLGDAWSGDAWQWIGEAQRVGFPTGKTPVAGAIMVVQRNIKGQSGQFGHVAYVEQVDLAHNQFLVSESNFNGHQGSPGDTRWISRAAADFDFIYGGPAGGGPPSPPPPAQVDIARTVVLASNGRSGYVFDLSGGIHPFGGAQDLAINGYWSGQDMIRGAVLATDTSGYTLDRQGGLHPFGSATPVTVSGYWPGQNLARGVVLRSDGHSGYVLDAYGGLSPFGGALPVAVVDYWPGQDIARAVVLRSDEHSGYIFDLSGGIHPFGGAPVVGTNGYWAGQDMIRGAALATDNSGYTLDRQGGMHPFGDAPPVTVSGTWPSDTARGVALHGRAGYALDRCGGLSPFGGALWEAVSAYWC